MANKCSCCNRTNDKRVVSFEEQYFKGPYIKDPWYPTLDICIECNDSINEALYEEEDESEYTKYPTE